MNNGGFTTAGLRLCIHPTDDNYPHGFLIVPIALCLAWERRARLADGVRARDIDNKILAVLGVDEYVNGFYFRQKQVPVALYIGYYQSQRRAHPSRFDV